MSVQYFYDHRPIKNTYSSLKNIDKYTVNSLRFAPSNPKYSRSERDLQDRDIFVNNIESYNHSKCNKFSNVYERSAKINNVNKYRILSDTY